MPYNTRRTDIEKSHDGVGVTERSDGGGRLEDGVETDVKMDYSLVCVSYNTKTIFPRKLLGTLTLLVLKAAASAAAAGARVAT